MSDAKLVKVATREAIEHVDPIDALVQKAVESGSVDVLERLLKVRQQVQADRARDAFYAALIGFQNACPVIEKSAQANIKPGFSYRYTPIEDIAHAVRDLLNQFQLGYRWFATQAGQSLTVTCRISHALGHIEETSLTVPVGTDPQRPAWPVAQSLTYAKRYTLCNALGIVVGGEDDDAQEPRPVEQEAKAEAQQPERPASGNPPTGLVISEPQRKRLWAIAHSAKWTEAEVKALLREGGYEHDKDIKRADYETICKTIGNAPARGNLDDVPF